MSRDLLHRLLFKDLYGLYTGVAAGYGLLVLLYGGVDGFHVLHPQRLGSSSTARGRHRSVTGLGSGWNRGMLLQASCLTVPTQCMQVVHEAQRRSETAKPAANVSLQPADVLA